MTPYKTLMRRAQGEFVVNKSRFIGHGCPCESEEQALAFIAQVRRAHPAANHNVYAYIIAPNMGVMRYSDDGEPSGTAGLPVIEVMKARGVTNACVVVTRYFGGVLLGAGGLVRAYAQGAKLALESGQVGVMHVVARYLMEIPYPLLGRIEHHLKDQSAIVEEKSYAESITMTLVVKVTDEEDFLRGITQVSDGQIEPLRMEQLYLAWPE